MPATAIVAPYNSLRGDPYFNMDARIAKNIKLGEKRNLQLMFQAFNLTNHANYGNNFGNRRGRPRRTSSSRSWLHQPDEQLAASRVHR